MKRAFLTGVLLAFGVASHAQDEVYVSDSLTMDGSSFTEGYEIKIYRKGKSIRFVELHYGKDDTDMLAATEAAHQAWNCEDYLGIFRGRTVYLGICLEVGGKMFFVGPSTHYRDAMVFHHLRRIDKP